jgi:hypothetical protein
MSCTTPAIGAVYKHYSTSDYLSNLRANRNESLIICQTKREKNSTVYTHDSIASDFLSDSLSDSLSPSKRFPKIWRFPISFLKVAHNFVSAAR